MMRGCGADEISTARHFQSHNSLQRCSHTTHSHGLCRVVCTTMVCVVRVEPHNIDFAAVEIIQSPDQFKEGGSEGHRRDIIDPAGVPTLSHPPSLHSLTHRNNISHTS